MQFDPVLKGLQRVTQAPVRYFTQIEHIGVTPEGQEFTDQLIICLGEHGFFIVNKGMDKLQGEVAYTHIDKVSEQKDKKRDPNIIQLELSPNRSPLMPARVTFTTSSKEVFLKHLRCYWQTDYMWRLNKVATLKIMKENIPTKRKAVSAASMPLLIEPRKGYKREPFMGYYFFLPQVLSSHPLQDEWKGKQEDAELTLSIDVNDLQPAESMKTELRSKAEARALILADGQRFWYIVNSQHIKKCNLSGDIASWRGWLVNTRTSQKEITVLIMRRKYIPPLMDSGQDISIVLVSDRPQTKLVTLITDIGDSFHTFPDNNSPHTEVITRKLQSLLLDEEGYRYYTTHLGFKLQYLTEVQRIIYSIIKLLAKGVGDDSLALLDKKLRDAVPNISVEDIMEIVDKIVAEVGVSQPQVRRSWSQKLARFLAYCIDGGLFYGQFTLSTIVSQLVAGQIRDKGDSIMIRKFINFLLHLKKVNADYTHITDLSLRLKEMKVQEDAKAQVEDDYFNERVMIVLLEEEYIQRELEISGDFEKMEPLLNYFLSSRTSSIDLKCAVCRYVIGVYAGKADNISLKFVLPQLMECTKSTSGKLATLASTAIVNMTRSNEQVKRELLTEENFLETLKIQLNTPNQSLLINLLRAFNNMTSNSTYRKFIGEHLLDSFVQIVRGTGIPGAEYSDEVLTPTVALLTLLARDVESKERLLQEFNIMTLLDKLLDNGEEVQSRVFVFLQKMVNRGVDLKKFVGDMMMEKLTEKLGDVDHIKTGDYVKQLLSLLMLLTTSHDANVAKFKAADGVAKLESFKQTKWATDQAARAPLEKLISSVNPAT